jgi:hypothetical protein
MRDGVRRAGYAVQGDLETLVPRWPENGRSGVDPAHAGPSPEGTLALAVRVLLDGHGTGGTGDRRETDRGRQT